MASTKESHPLFCRCFPACYRSRPGITNRVRNNYTCQTPLSLNHCTISPYSYRILQSSRALAGLIGGTYFQNIWNIV
jgi:hypothetical protein